MDEKAVRYFVKEMIMDKGIFLVDVDLKPGNVIHITVDKTEGISIEECVELSRKFNSAFDRDVEDYDLKVSSPGLDTAFKVDEQFEKYRNEDVRVLMKNGEKFKAKLLDFDDREIKLLIRRKVKEEGKKKKKLVSEEKTFRREDIKAVTAVISFK
jgi:ribosome maturation factor RimP